MKKNGGDAFSNFSRCLAAIAIIIQKYVSDRGKAMFLKIEK